MIPPFETRPAINKSHRGRYPFRLATTSFIYRAGYGENAARLAPLLDELELLFFESRHPDSLPDTTEINSLQTVGRESGLRYNVHLPIDIDLAARDRLERERAVSVVRYLVSLVQPLRPASFTLHLEGHRNGGTGWQQRACESLQRILATGIDSRRLAIETLEEPFETLFPLVRKLGLSICLDLGHLILHGHDLERHLDRYLDHTTVIHLHGVHDGRDHLPLDLMPASHLAVIFDRLRFFRGTLSLEVFSLECLQRSLPVVAKEMERRTACSS
jgi:sugar phosphate isomerase/epimerase